MKKIILTSVLFYSFLIQSNAQVTFGVKGGLGLSRVGYGEGYTKDYRSENNLPKKSFMFVPSIYGIVSIPITKTFSVHTGVGLNQQAYSYNETFVYYTMGWNMITHSDAIKGRLNYLEVPLYVSCKLPFGQRKFDFFAGASFGLNLGGRAEIYRNEFHNATETMDYRYTKEEHFTVDIHPGEVPTGGTYNPKEYNKGIFANEYNWSVLGGINYQLNKRILLGVEAKIGLHNIAPHDYRGWFGMEVEDDQREKVVKTQSYTFTVTYLFGQGKNAE